MKPNTNKDYTNLTKVAKNCGLIPYIDRFGKIIPGFYTKEGLEAPIDLTTSAENELSILKNALEQLSKNVDDSYHRSIERDLND